MSENAEQVRRYDRPRFLLCQFAPPDRREALLALLAFNLEIAKTREVVSEPLLGQMRLQWWRESLEPVFAAPDAPVRRHAVLDVLAPAVRSYGLSAAAFEALLTAREQDLEPDPPPTEVAFLAYAEAISAPLLHLMLAVLSADDADSLAAARAAGTAHAIAGLLAAIPVQARQGRVTLPTELLASHGLTPRALIDAKAPRLPALVARLAAHARRSLAEARSLRPGVAREAMPVLLSASLATNLLGRLAQAGHDPFHPSLRRADPWLVPRLTWGAWRGRY